MLIHVTFLFKTSFCIRSAIIADSSSSQNSLLKLGFYKSDKISNVYLLQVHVSIKGLESSLARSLFTEGIVFPQKGLTLYAKKLRRRQFVGLRVLSGGK